MGEKVTINGKEYTERTISFIEINGTKVTDGMITPDMSKGGSKISAIIKVDGTSFEAASSDFMVQGEASKVLINNVDEKESIESIPKKKEIGQDKENKSWIVKLIEKIKNIFRKI